MCKIIKDIVTEFRKKEIEGICINLVPFTQVDAEKVVELRNRKKNRYFLNQVNRLTVEDQLDWYRSYQQRDNDIYWCVYNKVGQFIGTIRIYNINPEEDICEHGSFIIAEEFADEAPYAVETALLSLDFVFDVLKLQNVINVDRIDNKVMNSLTRKLGFTYKSNTKIGEIDYKYYILSCENYKQSREKFAQVVKYWETR